MADCAGHVAKRLIRSFFKFLCFTAQKFGFRREEVAGGGPQRSIAGGWHTGHSMPGGFGTQLKRRTHSWGVSKWEWEPRSNGKVRNKGNQRRTRPSAPGRPLLQPSSQLHLQVREGPERERSRHRHAGT